MSTIEVNKEVLKYILKYIRLDTVECHDECPMSRKCDELIESYITITPYHCEDILRAALFDLNFEMPSQEED